MEAQEFEEKQLNTIREDIQLIKNTVQRIEKQQEETIMDMRDEINRLQRKIQVLNRRLFEIEIEVEANTEEI